MIFSFKWFMNHQSGYLLKGCRFVKIFFSPELQPFAGSGD